MSARLPGGIDVSELPTPGCFGVFGGLAFSATGPLVPVEEALELDLDGSSQVVACQQLFDGHVGWMLALWVRFFQVFGLVCVCCCSKEMSLHLFYFFFSACRANKSSWPNTGHNANFPVFQTASPQPTSSPRACGPARQGVPSCIIFSGKCPHQRRPDVTPWARWSRRRCRALAKHCGQLTWVLCQPPQVLHSRI